MTATLLSMVIGQRRRIGDVRSVERRVDDEKVASYLFDSQACSASICIGIDFLR